MLTDIDHEWVRFTFRLAEATVAAGDQPFAAVLVGPDGALLIEGRQTRATTNDCTAHAEMNVLRGASPRWDWEFLERCTLYSSTEPCLMCTGAFAWSGIGRLVFGVSQARMYAEFAGAWEPRFRAANSCREPLADLQPPVVVDGPSWRMKDSLRFAWHGRR